MKISRNGLFQISLALLTIAILSSCSSLRDQFSKQKYTGFKVKHHRINESPVSLSNNRSTTSSSGTQSLKLENSANETFTVPEHPHSVLQQPHYTAPVSPSVTGNNHEVTTTREVQKWERKIQKLKRGSAQSGESDVALIVLVLLAIFIPPLAIYLVEKTTGRFWVALIFCLLSFSAFYFAFGGLLWLIAIILALLAVLG